MNFIVWKISSSSYFWLKNDFSKKAKKTAIVPGFFGFSTSGSFIWNIFYLYMSLPSWRRYSWCHLGRWHGLGDRRLQGGRGRERQRLGGPFGIHLSRSWWSENRWVFFLSKYSKVDKLSTKFGWVIRVYFCWSCWWKEKGKSWLHMKNHIQKVNFSGIHCKISSSQYW